MLNGIQVVASNRGALPETVAGGGILLSIPAHYTPETQDVPTPEEVAPWVEAILRLWDDPAYYDEASRRALESADRFRPERVAELHDKFFREMAAG
jgi:glycosyltransferase involved in cell wall biosynthesis